MLIYLQIIYITFKKIAAQMHYIKLEDYPLPLKLVCPDQVDQNLARKGGSSHFGKTQFQANNQFRIRASQAGYSRTREPSAKDSISH